MAQNKMEATNPVQATSEVISSNDKKCDWAFGTGVKQIENGGDENSSSDSDVVLSDLTTEGTRKSTRHPSAKAARG